MFERTILKIARAAALNYSAAFHVRNTSNGQVLPFNIWTKVDWDEEIMDSHGWFDMANFRYLPRIAGWYHCSGLIEVLKVPSGTFALGLSVYKNGAVYKGQFVLQGHTIAGQSISVNQLIELNGTTDYGELFAYADNSNPGTSTVEANSWFWGHLVRAL